MVRLRSLLVVAPAMIGCGTSAAKHGDGSEPGSPVDETASATEETSETAMPVVGGRLTQLHMAGVASSACTSMLAGT